MKLKAYFFQLVIVYVLILGLVPALRAQIIISSPVRMQAFGSMKGRVVDGRTGMGIQGVSIMAKTGDTTMVSYTFSDDKGDYLLERLPVDKSIKISTFVQGYTGPVKEVKLNLMALSLTQDWQLQREANTLNEVEIKAKKPLFVIRKDTLEFDATAIKLLPHAILEDLFRRLPGMSIEKDGTISVNGKRADKIQIDGHDFFGGNISIATQNLPAGIVDKVQVTPSTSLSGGYNQLLKQASENVTINVLLKKDQNTGFIGNLSAGMGTRKRYSVNGLLGSFGGAIRYGLYTVAGNGAGMFNLPPVMQQGATLSQGSMQGSAGASGTGSSVSSGSSGSRAGSISGGNRDIKNISASFNMEVGKKIKVDGNYAYSVQHTFQDKLTDRENYFDAGGSLYQEKRNDSTGQQKHSFSTIIEYHPDSLSVLKFSPSLGISDNTSVEHSVAKTTGVQGSELNSAIADNKLTGRSQNFQHNLEFGRRSKDKKSGLSLNWAIGAANKSGSVSNLAQNEYFSSAGAGVKTIVNQKGSIMEKSFSNSLSFQMSQAIADRFTVGLEYSLNQKSENIVKRIFNNDPLSDCFGRLDSTLSGDNKNTVVEQFPSLQVAYRSKQFEISLNGGMRFSVQKTRILFLDTMINVRQRSLNPKLLARYNFSERSWVNFVYGISATMPSALQLSPITDNSNPLIQTTGNPFLKPSLSHNLNVAFSGFLPAAQLSMSAGGGYNVTKNKIVQDISYDTRGGQVQTFRNVDGSNSVSFTGGISVSRAFNNLNVRPGLRIALNSVNEVGYANNIKSETKGWQNSASADVSVSYKDILSFSPTASVFFNRTSYTLSLNTVQRYDIQDYGFDFKLSPMSRLEFDSHFSFQYNSQIPAEFQRRSSILNCAVTVRFLRKEELAFKASVNDLFNNAVANTTSLSPSFREDVSVNALKRYFLFTLQYNFNSLYGGNK